MVFQNDFGGGGGGVVGGGGGGGGQLAEYVASLYETLFQSTSNSSP